MRLTFDPMRDGLQAINTASNQLQLAQLAAATGKRILKPSDDPAGAQQALAERAELGAIDDYQHTADSASSRLAAADSALGDIVDKLTQAMSTVTGVRGSSVNQAARASAATTLTGIRDAIRADLNSSFQGNSIFAGGNVDRPAYAMVNGAWTYQGDNNVVQVEVDRVRTVTIGFDGHAIAQGGDANDVLTELDQLVTAVTSGDDAGMASGLAALSRAFDRTNQAQGRLGSDESSIADTQIRLTARRTAVDARRSKLEDANMAEAITRMSQADTAYKAALGAVSSVEKLSLLDYLR
jgi:flagellar hook-associated protein 3 FlgL